MSKKKNLGDLITDNKEYAEKLSSVDIKMDSDKDMIEKKSKLILENKQNTKELSAAYKIITLQKEEIEKQAADIIHADKEKAKCKADLVIAKKESILTKQKKKHMVELTIVNKELTDQIEQSKQTELALKESNEKYLKAYQ